MQQSRHWVPAKPSLKVPRTLRSSQGGSTTGLLPPLSKQPAGLSTYLELGSLASIIIKYTTSPPSSHKGILGWQIPESQIPNRYFHIISQEHCWGPIPQQCVPSSTTDNGWTPQHQKGSRTKTGLIRHNPVQVHQPQALILRFQPSFYICIFE